MGSTWDEPFILPIDPELLFQRTGFACMDEDSFRAAAEAAKDQREHGSTQQDDEDHRRRQRRALAGVAGTDAIIATPNQLKMPQITFVAGNLTPGVYFDACNPGADPIDPQPFTVRVNTIGA